MTDDRQWIISTLRHRQTHAVPYNLSLSPPARATLEAHYGTADLESALGLPIRSGGPRSVKPLYAVPAQFGPTATDEFGVVWTTSDIDRGVPIGPCLREPSLSGYTFPDPAAAYRFDHLERWTAVNAGHWTLLWVGDLWSGRRSCAAWRRSCWTSCLSRASSRRSSAASRTTSSGR